MISVNQVGFDRFGPKSAVVMVEAGKSLRSEFALIEVASGATVFTSMLDLPQTVDDWNLGQVFCRADFSEYTGVGEFQVVAMIDEEPVISLPFRITVDGLAGQTLPAIISYFYKQRANTPQELAADAVLRVKGRTETVDMRGGWCDASGDVSKYLSHLSYANFMSPQQTPLVIWSLASTRDSIPDKLAQWDLTEKLDNEALWGCDYLMRSLTADDYFYGIVFSFFNPDPSTREVVGLHADSVTTDEVQAAFREGGGMAIAALARVSTWGKDGEFTSDQYLDGAERAFAHLLKHNLEYDDDGKENIIDDYCALMAATELWIATGKPLYEDEARKRAANLTKRLTPEGYFISDDGTRPFWHASDAGLPVIALARYLDMEDDFARRVVALATIKRNLDFQLTVTNAVPNPFGYARQTISYKGAAKDSFFIPHENETGWWWQGENARLGSLAAAAIVGGRLVSASDDGPWGVSPALAEFAMQQLSWILGGNPYAMCFLKGFGVNNVHTLPSMFGHGPEIGGIANGVTGSDRVLDGSGIAFRTDAGGDEWRWNEQWLPHAAWFLQALAAMA